MQVLSGLSQAQARNFRGVVHQSATRNSPGHAPPPGGDRVDLSDERHEAAVAAVERVGVVFGVALGTFVSMVALPSPFNYLGAAACIGGGIYAAIRG